MEEFDVIAFDFVTNNNGYGGIMCGDNHIQGASYVKHLSLMVQPDSSVEENQYFIPLYGIDIG